MIFLLSRPTRLSGNSTRRAIASETRALPLTEVGFGDGA
jgi:hypothetical protein